MIETRIAVYRFQELDEDLHNDLQDLCKKYAKTLEFNRDFEYYAVYWLPENWLLANLCMPEIKYILRQVP